MANLWSKAVGQIHRQYYKGQALSKAMKDGRTRQLYAQLQNNSKSRKSGGSKQQQQKQQQKQNNKSRRNRTAKRKQ